jgi:hypothetical protein
MTQTRVSESAGGLTQRREGAKKLEKYRIEQKVTEGSGESRDLLPEGIAKLV